MTEIDYEALADAMSRAALEALGQATTLDEVNQTAARAVVAALAEQGMVVARLGERPSTGATEAVRWLSEHGYTITIDPKLTDGEVRLGVRPPDKGETT